MLLLISNDKLKIQGVKTEQYYIPSTILIQRTTLFFFFFLHRTLGTASTSAEKIEKLLSEDELMGLYFFVRHH